MIARADAGIATFADLKGKRVNIGNPGSGQFATMQVVMDALGWTMDDFALASELKPAEQAAALGDNKVDAIIYTVGHPNGSIQEAVSTVDAVLIPVTGPEIDKLIADNLSTRGYTVTFGEEGGAPDDATVVVTYVDKWMWDITMYLIELTITFRDPTSGAAIGSGNSYHTSLTRLSPDEMVDEVLNNVFAADSGEESSD